MESQPKPKPLTIPTVSLLGNFSSPNFSPLLTEKLATHSAMPASLALQSIRVVSVPSTTFPQLKIAEFKALLKFEDELENFVSIHSDIALPPLTTLVDSRFLQILRQLAPNADLSHGITLLKYLEALLRPKLGSQRSAELASLRFYLPKSGSVYFALVTHCTKFSRYAKALKVQSETARKAFIESLPSDFAAQVKSILHYEDADESPDDSEIDEAQSIPALSSHPLPEPLIPLAPAKPPAPAPPPPPATSTADAPVTLHAEDDVSVEPA